MRRASLVDSLIHGSQFVICHLLSAICRLALRTPLRVLQFGDVLGADGVDGHAVEQPELPLHGCLERQVRAGCLSQDARHSTGIAQRPAPGPLVLAVASDQPAFLEFTTTVVVAEEVGTIDGL
jgi:hypothetical protein